MPVMSVSKHWSRNILEQKVIVFFFVIMLSLSLSLPTGADDGGLASFGKEHLGGKALPAQPR